MGCGSSRAVSVVEAAQSASIEERARLDGAADPSAAASAELQSSAEGEPADVSSRSGGIAEQTEEGKEADEGERHRRRHSDEAKPTADNSDDEGHAAAEERPPGSGGSGAAVQGAEPQEDWSNGHGEPEGDGSLALRNGGPAAEEPCSLAVSPTIRRLQKKLNFVGGASENGEPCLEAVQKSGHARLARGPRRATSKGHRRLRHACRPTASRHNHPLAPPRPAPPSSCSSVGRAAIVHAAATSAAL